MKLYELVKDQSGAIKTLGTDMCVRIPHTDIYVSSHCDVSDAYCGISSVLLYMFSHTACYMCPHTADTDTYCGISSVLLYMCPHTAFYICVLIPPYTDTYCSISSVFIHVFSYCMLYVSSYRILSSHRMLYMCPHTAYTDTYCGISSVLQLRYI